MNVTEETLILVDNGAVSEVTRGNPLLWPFSEQGVPPFNHWDPFL